MAWYEHATMDVAMKSIMTIAVIIGFVYIDFIWYILVYLVAKK